MENTYSFIRNIFSGKPHRIERGNGVVTEFSYTDFLGNSVYLGVYSLFLEVISLLK
jgi:hypothetical protein